MPPTKNYADYIHAALNDPKHPWYERIVEVPTSLSADEDDPHNRLVSLRSLTVADLSLAEAWHRQRVLAEFQAQIRYTNNLAVLLACLSQASPHADETVGQIAERLSIDEEKIRVFSTMRACEDPERTTADILNELAEPK